MSRSLIQKLDAVVVLSAALAVAAAGLCGLALWQEQTLASLARPTPQRMTLQQLVAQGPGDNIHVTVTEFSFAPDWVFEERQGKWTRVWIPLHPGTDAADADEFQVIARTADAPDEAAVEQFYRQTELTGLIVNSIHRLRSPELIVLEREYPHIEAAQILVLDTSRRLTSPETLALLRQLTMGLPIIAFAAVAIWFAVRRWACR